MSWLSDAVDAISGVGDFVSNNAGWIKPVLGGIGGAVSGSYGAQQSQAQGNAYLDYLRAKEQQNFNQAQQQYQYDLAALQNRRPVSYTGPSAAALQQGMQAKLNSIKQIQSLYQPYAQTGAQILPQMASLYGAGNQATAQALAAQLTPEKMQLLNQAVASPAQQAIPLPSSLYGRK